jgi:hypothetical protein
MSRIQDCDIAISSHTFAHTNLALQNGTNNVQAIVALVVARLHGR